VAENVAGTERALHLEPRPEARLDDLTIALPAGATGVTTIAASPPQRRPGTSEPIAIVALAGRPTIVDSARDLLGDQSGIDRSLTWTRHAASFFQANRFLVGALVQRVLEAAAGESCVDLYAGVGLFSAALAAGGARVVAVEGDAVSTADLRINAAPWADRLRVAAMPVERFLRSPGLAPPDVVVLDPPRTGVDARALNSLLEWGVRRLVYVSCDPPTMARDARRLLDGGYRLLSLRGFDLFPNTPHVETMGVFELC
jgi:tRNA/tmRNA/rRNA uracil-C5-methylase (TrmA/RlmC/RlmD family)